MSKQPQHWGVVGGGMLGMSLAKQLVAKGHKVSLIESQPTLGGLASAYQIGDITWDRFYHVILLSDAYTRGLLTDLDLDKEMEWVETKTGFFTDGKLYSMSNSLEFLKFPPMNLIDKFRLGMTIFYASKVKNWKKLEQIPVETWLRKLSGNRTFEKMWLPLLRAKLGESYKETSAAFIWSTIQRMYAARKSGMKKEMFGYLPGGYARILEAFSKHLEASGVEFHLGQPVQKIEKGNNGMEVWMQNGDLHSFDQVVCTLASPIANKICQGLSREESRLHQGIRYLGVVCPSFLLKKPLSPFYVTNITDDGIPFTGLIEMTALVDRKEFGGKSLVYLPKYALPDDPVFTESQEDLKDRFFSALQRVHPDLKKEDILGVEVPKAKFVFALPGLGYSQKLPPVTTSVPGLHILNSSQIVNGTLNVNETLKLAVEFIPNGNGPTPGARMAPFPSQEGKESIPSQEGKGVRRTTGVGK